MVERADFTTPPSPQQFCWWSIESCGLLNNIRRIWAIEHPDRMPKRCWRWLTHYGPPAIDPRDPDPTREGIFRNHNCWKCKDGAQPCAQGDPWECDYPHARND